MSHTPDTSPPAPPPANARPLLRRLFIRNFRSYSELDLQFEPGLNVFAGPNGAGKTNILEAIHYLGLGQSFRTGNDAEAVRWTSDGFYLKGVRHDSLGDLTLEVAVQPARGKAVKVGGRQLQSLSGLYGLMPCVIFTPGELGWVQGAPSIRRRWLDRLLAQTDAAYPARLAQFRDALAQRNNLLTDAAHGSGSSRALLGAWTDEYLDAAAPVAASRARLVAAISPLLREELAHIAPGEEAHLRMKGRLWREAAGEGEAVAASQTMAPSAWRQLYESALQQVADQETRRGHTLVGPHRDDVLPFLGDRDARRFASQGQQRSFVLALKLAAVRYIEDTVGKAPTLLLDDIFSELDPLRRQRLAALVHGRAQAFLTTTEVALVPSGQAARLFGVERGQHGGRAFELLN